MEKVKKRRAGKKEEEREEEEKDRETLPHKTLSFVQSYDSWSSKSRRNIKN